MQEHSLSREEEKDHLLNGGWTEDSAFIHFITRLFSILTPHIPGSFLLAEPLFTPLRGNELQTLHSSSSQTTPIAALNALHEFGYWKDNNNQHGVILTPEDAADAVIERCFIDTPTPSSLTILDPACGTGILLCRSLLWAYRNKLFSTSQEAANFIRHSIYGIDRDPVAVSLSRFALLLTLSQLFPEDMSNILGVTGNGKGIFIVETFFLFEKVIRNESSTPLSGKIRIFPHSSLISLPIRHTVFLVMVKFEKIFSRNIKPSLMQFFVVNPINIFSFLQPPFHISCRKADSPFSFLIHGLVFGLQEGFVRKFCMTVI